MDMAQKEVRVTLSKELKQIIEQRAKSLGIKAVIASFDPLKSD